jgi:integrase
VELGLLLANPAVRAKPPRVRQQITTEPWSAQDLRRFLEFVSSDALYPVWRLLASTGLRRGELMGLRWEDIDLERVAC